MDGLQGRNFFLPKSHFESKVYLESAADSGTDEVWWEWRYLHSYLAYKQDPWEWLRLRQDALEEMEQELFLQPVWKSSTCSKSKDGPAHTMVTTSWVLALLVNLQSR